MKKNDLTNKLTVWLKNNYEKSKNGKTFFTRYDILKSLCELEYLKYEEVEKFLAKNEKANNFLNDWLNNNLWHMMINLKIPVGINLYIENEIKLRTKKFVPNFVNDIPTPKIKVEKFTMNNEIDGVPNFDNDNDEIMNLGKEEDFEDLDIPFEEENGPEHEE